MQPINLPDLFTPFSSIRSDANLFQNTFALVTVAGHAPLLIGNGPVPSIWLFTRDIQAGSAWQPCIQDNTTTRPDLTVSAHPRLINVSMGPATLINATRGANDGLVIHTLDLRALGLNMFADEMGLHLMGNTMVKSVWHNTPVIVVVPAVQ